MLLSFQLHVRLICAIKRLLTYLLILWPRNAFIHVLTILLQMSDHSCICSNLFLGSLSCKATLIYRTNSNVCEFKKYLHILCSFNPVSGQQNRKLSVYIDQSTLRFHGVM